MISASRDGGKIGVCILVVNFKAFLSEVLAEKGVRFNSLYFKALGLENFHKFAPSTADVKPF